MPSGSLWRHHDFMLLWLGSTVSEMGSAVTTLALPLVAVTALRADPFQVGLLNAFSSLAFLFVALPAGTLVDRLRKRPLLITADVSRALVLISIPLAGSVARLTLFQLYVVALVTGILTVVFDIAYQSFLPALVGKDRLVEGNSKLGMPSALADAIGPSIGGSLVAVLGAVSAIAVDSISFLGNVFALSRIRTHESRPQRHTETRRSLRAEIAEGLSFVFRHAILRRIVACTAASNLFNSIRTAVIVVFLVHDLHASSATIGLVLSLGSIGGMAGAVAAGWLSRRFGSARMLWLSKAALGWIMLTIPLAQPGPGVTLISLGLFVGSISATIYNVVQVAYRQSICPAELLGRVNASVRWIIWGTMPLGGALGGWLGITIGVRETLVVAALGSWLSVLFIVASPVARMRDIPGGQPEHAAPPAKVTRRATDSET